jgi:hypothetical protein
MKLSAFESIAKALNTAKVRYLVAGGLAVNAHGYLRSTFDVDLVIQLDPDNIIKAFEGLAAIGYRPMVPVTGLQFADASQRRQWIRQKRMQVLNFHSAQFPQAPVDVFVTEPFDFDAEYQSALRGRPVPGVSVRFVSIPTLIKMKRLANRPKDRDDIEHLRQIVRHDTNVPKKR